MRAASSTVVQGVRWFAALGVAALYGCQAVSAPFEESTAEVKQALAPAVSAPFELEPTVEAPGADPSTTLQTVSACGAERCFAAYEQIVGSGEDSDWGTRFSAGAEMLDAPRVSLSAPGWPMQVLASGSDFVVVQGQGVGSQTYTALSRVRGSDGVRTSVVTTGLPPNSYSLSAATASSVLLINQYQGNQAYLYDNAFARIGSPVSIPLGVDLSTLVAGTDQYLVVAAGAAVRLDAKTGALLGTAIEFAKYVPLGTGPIRGAYKDGVYLLSWFSPANSDLLGVRIRASDGAVLDAPDEFNQTPGVKVLCAGCKQQTSTLGRYPHVNVIGGQFVVTFMRTTTSELFGFNVDASTGTRPDGATTLPAAIGNLPLAANVEVHAVANAAVARQGNFVYPFAPSSAPSGFTLGTKQPIALLAAPRSWLRVGTNGSDYLVTFSYGKALYATRVKESTGAVLDSPPLTLGTGTRAAIASDGSGYMVVWAKSYSAFARARVSADGAVTALADLPTNYTPGVSYPLPTDFELTFNGEYYCLAWTQGVVMYEKRMQPDGTPVDATAVGLRPGDYNAVGRTLLLADTTPTADRRTFLYVFANADLFTRRVRAQTGAVLGFTTLATGVSDGAFFSGASDGTNGLVAYQVGGNLSASIVDPVAATATSTVNVMSLGTTASLGRAWHDGLSFNLVLTGVTNEIGRAPAYLQRLDGALARLDSKVPGLGTPLPTLDNILDYDVAAAKGKRSLFAYADTAMDRFGIMARAVWIQNDGQPAPVPTGSGGATSTGSGGATSTSSGGATSTSSGGATSTSGGNTSGGNTSVSNGGITSAGTSSSSGGNAPRGGTASTNGGSSAGSNAGGSNAGGSDAGGVNAGGSDAGGDGAGQTSTQGGQTTTPSGGASSGNAGTGTTTTRGGTSAAGTSSMGGSPKLPINGEPSGCGCRTVPQRSPSTTWLAFAALGVVVVRRRGSAKARAKLDLAYKASKNATSSAFSLGVKTKPSATS